MTYTLLLIFALTQPLAVNGETANSKMTTALPLQIRGYLNKNYPGWKLMPTADGCSARFRGASASGDFDGDGGRDYLVKFVKRGRGYIMAFLKRKSDYEAHVLHGNMSGAEIKSTGISVFRKGERVPTGDAEEDGSTEVLTNDAPFDGPCESDAGGVHTYRNGKFN
jgi:hypothetical protein